jgi:hypothetical protein
MAQNGNNFLISLIATLKKAASKAQIKSDIKDIESSNNLFVKLIGKLDLAKTRQTIKAQLSNLKNFSISINTKVNTKNIQTGTKAAINASQNVANKNKVKVGLSFETDKKKLLNELSIFSQKNSKLFTNADLTAQFNKIVDATKIAKSRTELKALRSELSAFGIQIRSLGMSGMTYMDKFKATISRFSEWFSAGTFVYTLTNALKSAVDTAIDLDSAYTNLIKVQNELSRSDYPNYLAEVNEKAKELATTQQALIEGATEFSKSGYSQSEADALSSVSAVLSNVGEMDASDAAKAIISGVQAYSEIDGLTDTIEKANALIDKYNEIGRMIAA